MSLVLVSIPLALLVLAVRQYWNRLFMEKGGADAAALLPWLGRGLVLPLLGWIGLNLGLSSAIPPLIPEIALAKSAGKSWLPLAFELTVPGALIIGSYWAAISFAYLLTEIAIRTEAKDELLLTSAILSLVLLPFAVLAGWAGGCPAAGVAVLVWLVPLAHCTVSFAARAPAIPDYSSATARIKFGKYKEAELAVIGELEKSEDDFDGWLMLAELYATRFGDLREADQTIRTVCDQPSTTSLQISLAFHRLADWHLKLTDNPVAARRALAEIVRRLPGGHFAKMAQLRLDQLPASRRDWLEQQKPKTIRLPPLNDSLDDSAEPGSAPVDRTDALSLSQDLVEKLKQNPNDVEAREKLAYVLADRLGKADLAIEQLELLLGMPSQPGQKQARWLGLIAAWHLRHRRDFLSAKRVLEQLIREHPQTAEGFAAQRRLRLIEMDELMAKHAVPAPLSH